MARSAEPSSTSPDQEAEQVKLLSEAGRLVDGGQSGDAITYALDKVIAHFEKKYRNSTNRIYCAHSSAESLGYLTVAASKKESAVVISGTWAEAYFLKGFALINLQRASEGKAFIESAVALSPHNPQYLSELGHCFTLEKNWAKAEEMFKAAEGRTETAPSNEKEMKRLSRALRGQAYVLVEFGKLDEAESIYQRCLKLDPNDKTAKAELGYVRGLRSKKSGDKLPESKTGNQ
ncbi:MAG: diguanylate cyclase/phosphodiesterase domain [Verrucomicrobiales bacterium]|nr:diguanylate cyclase/phosphodiesterase domain [Verrucomicrobiales bacterium]